MDFPILSRRAALAAIAGAVVFPVLARAEGTSGAWTHFRGIEVDVTALRRAGDTISADFIARELPGFLRQHFAAYLTPGDRRAPLLVARIDSVMYGPDGGISLPGSGSGAMDYIEGAGVVIGGSGREVASYPLMSSMTARVNLTDVTGEAVKLRMTNLTQSFAAWLPGKMGL